VNKIDNPDIRQYPILITEIEKVLKTSNKITLIKNKQVQLEKMEKPTPDDLEFIGLKIILLIRKISKQDSKLE